MSIRPTSSDALLDYSLNTLPDPMQVSPGDGNPVHAGLGFVISNPKGSDRPVSVSSLKFSFPVGSGAQQLTNDPIAILYSISAPDAWDIQASADGGSYVFTVVPQSGSPVSITTEGLVFQFFNIPVNQTAGTVQITVTEKASSTADGLQARKAYFNPAKFPYGFYFGNLTPGVAMVQDNQSVTLTWQGSSLATYTMMWGKPEENDKTADVTEVRQWTSPPLHADTTFLLRAEVVLQSETVTQDLTTTVVVAKPELALTSLSVSGTSSLLGATTVGESGGTTGLTVNGPLSVAGPSTLGNADVTGDLTLSGHVSMLGAWNTTGPNSCTQAKTDGFVCASASDTHTITGRTSATTENFTISWQEVPDIMHHPLTYETKPRPDKVIARAPSFMMPVRNGDFWGVYTDDQESGTNKFLTATVYWIPLGKPT